MSQQANKSVSQKGKPGLTLFSTRLEPELTRKIKLAAYGQYESIQKFTDKVFRDYLNLPKNREEA